MKCSGLVPQVEPSGPQGSDLELLIKSDTLRGSVRELVVGLLRAPLLDTSGWGERALNVGKMAL